LPAAPELPTSLKGLDFCGQVKVGIRSCYAIVTSFGWQMIVEAENIGFAKMKSIQAYIDERPVWPDGTPMSGAPMTNMQWLIWSLAAAGKFFEGYVVFMTGVALPLISREFGIGAAENGLIGAASLLGILVGAVGLGGMSDRYGRKPMFIIEMFIFVAFLILLILTQNFLSLIICLFGIGLALGCDYPTAT
jgi:putative MFS transporter